MSAPSTVISAAKLSEGKIICETIDTSIPKKNLSNVRNVAKDSVNPAH
jgi:hypothetical protein